MKFCSAKFHWTKMSKKIPSWHFFKECSVADLDHFNASPNPTKIYEQKKSWTFPLNWYKARLKNIIRKMLLLCWFYCFNNLWFSTDGDCLSATRESGSATLLNPDPQHCSRKVWFWKTQGSYITSPEKKDENIFVAWIGILVLNTNI